MAMDIEVGAFANIVSQSECNGTDCNGIVCKKWVWYPPNKSGKHVSVITSESSDRSNNRTLDPFGKHKRDLSVVQGICVNET